MINLLITILVAAVVYAICLALGLPSVIGLVAALLVLLGGVGTTGWRPPRA